MVTIASEDWKKIQFNEISTEQGFRYFKDLKYLSKIPTLNPILTANLIIKIF